MVAGCFFREETIFTKTPAFDVGLSRLRAELEAHGTRGSRKEGTCPGGAVVQVGSCIKVHKTHSDIGSAYVHSSPDGKPRFAHPACMPVIMSGWSRRAG